MNTPLSKTTIALHWVVAIMMIMLLGSGIAMHEFDVRRLYPLHKSFGITITVFVLIRIYWRIKKGWPEPNPLHAAWERMASWITHYVLILATVMMPLSGMVMNIMGGKGLYWFGLELVARNPNPNNPMRNIPINKMIAGGAHEAHEIFAMITLAALLLHILGALKHHFLDKDNTLKRIVGRS